MRKIKNVLETLTAIITAGLFAVQMSQTLPLNVAVDTQETAIVFTLNA